ncbi:MAG TPA: YdcF family protein, partial [Promineifilum sp.]|nr:YdcF family protein [Promineifilum sp.]
MAVFVFLSKLLPLFVFPLGLAFLLLILALLWARARRLAIVLALVILWLGSSRYVAYSLVRSLEGRYPTLDGTPAADAIVVLGGGTRSNDPPRPMTEVNEAGDRLIYAARLYRDGAADVVLVTGGSIEWLQPEGVAPEANDMAALMQLLGVPDEALWLEAESRNTYENALYSQEMLAEAGLNDILLVTSAMHMPRSRAIFARQGFDVIPAPTDFNVTQAEWDYYWTPDPAIQIFNLLPSAETL